MRSNDAALPLFLPERFARRIIHSHPLDGPERSGLRKFIAFDEGTPRQAHPLTREGMVTVQELTDEVLADLLGKYGIPIDFEDALKESAPAVQQRDIRKR